MFLKCSYITIVNHARQRAASQRNQEMSPQGARAAVRHQSQLIQFMSALHMCTFHNTLAAQNIAWLYRFTTKTSVYPVHYMNNLPWAKSIMKMDHIKFSSDKGKATAAC